MTLVGGAVGYFWKEHREKKRRPKLAARIEPNRGSVVDPPMITPDGQSTGSARYVRLKVKNVGQRIAKDCRGVLVQVEKKDHDSYRETSYTDAIQLTWAYAQGEKRHEGKDLIKEVDNYLDLCEVKSWENVLRPQLVTRSSRYQDLFKEPGTYRLTVQLSAEEADPVLTQIILTWHGEWKTLEVSMEQ
jgi:hypothetical protein